MIRSALLLGAFAVAGTSGVVLVHHQTKERIAANERAELLRSLHEIIPDSAYDNDIVKDSLQVTAEALDGKEPSTIYLARKRNLPVGAVLTAVAPAGYNGSIKLLVGIYYNGSLAGARVVSHRETPGLGDKIEIRRDPWITIFDGRSIGDPPIAKWKVRHDSGVFDQFTGATITPRAVVNAIRQSLLYFDQHKEELFMGRPEQKSNE
ncbi:MAG: electron transport complex subunit RsxG [Gammaproteobacteria bacterium]|nr:electron transport complex subunit RsxG [Gammaproteobacteria bacterium]